MGSFCITERDKQVVNLYADFLPKKIFDAHMHIYCGHTIPNFYKPDGVFCRKYCTPKDYLADMDAFFPGVETVRLNMMPMLDPAQTDLSNGLRDHANCHIVDMAREFQYVGCVYILPCDNAETISKMASQPGIRGLKCYSYGAGRLDLEALAIQDYLPEAAWEVSSQLHIPIILHMMRPKALSDPENFAYINQMAHRYPDAKLVLAHCARAFAAWTAVRSIRELEDQGNIWFDMSAICEPGPMIASILKNAAKRTMWGSDYPICMNRGRAISLAEGQDWLIDRKETATYVAAENLLSFYQAALLLDLDATQVQDIFYNNAASLFQLPSNLL